MPQPVIAIFYCLYICAASEISYLWSSWSECDAEADAIKYQFFVDWSDRTACWTCARDTTAALIDVAEQFVSASKLIWSTSSNTVSATMGGEQNWSVSCLCAVTLGAFLLLRYAIDPPYAIGAASKMSEARHAWDFAATRLLTSLEMNAGGAGHIFDAELFQRHGVTATQLRYLQWQSRFKHIAVPWNSQGLPWTVTNVSLLKGVARCSEVDNGFDIFDFGAGRGWDSLFLTHGVGCRVLAVEADPRNVQWLRRLFRPLVARNRLEVLHTAIVAHQHDPSIMRFCSHAESEWSMPLDDLDSSKMPPCEMIVDVPTINCAKLISRFGLPTLYWKMDIERAELACLRSVQATEQDGIPTRWPRYISMEAPHSSIDIDDAFYLLWELGYTRYKLVSPKIFDSFMQNRGTNLGIYSSGLFGDDAVDEISGVKWRSLTAVKQDLLHCYIGFSEQHAHNLTCPSRRLLSVCSPAHAHFDIHAARPE